MAKRIRRITYDDGRGNEPWYELEKELDFYKIMIGYNLIWRY